MNRPVTREASRGSRRGSVGDGMHRPATRGLPEFGTSSRQDSRQGSEFDSPLLTPVTSASTWDPAGDDSPINSDGEPVSTFQSEFQGGEWDAYDAQTGTPDNGQQFEYDWAVEDSAATEAAIASGNGPREFDGFPTVDEIKAEDAYSDIFDDSDEDLVSDDE